MSGVSASRLQFSLKWMLAMPVVVAVLLMTDCFGLVGLRYPRAMENEPLLSPVAVAKVTGRDLILKDGRTVRVMDTFADSLETALQESNMQIDMESIEGTAEWNIYVKTRGWICGTPWARVVNIPLIPDDVPINRRQPLGMAVIIHPPKNR